MPVKLQMGEFLDEVTYHARFLFLKQQQKNETASEHSSDIMTQQITSKSKFIIFIIFVPKIYKKNQDTAYKFYITPLSAPLIF